MNSQKKNINCWSFWLGKNSILFERLEEDFEKQKRFVSDASHELRTPLAVIHGHVNVNMLNRWGKNDAEQLDMLLKEITDETLLRFKDAGISYDLSPELKIYADYDKLKQVLRIIIDNSIKFSRDSVRIIIDAHSQDEGILITIGDKGIGIPADSLSKIFDRFYRVDDSRTKATGGTGLGLSIARQIVDCHGGTISAESKLGEGTRISIFIPGASSQK